MASDTLNETPMRPSIHRLTRPDRPAYKISRNGCWVWLGAFTQKGWRGYGYRRWNGKVIPAHRIFYEELVGPIPLGMDIDHICRKRKCVNPAHLRPLPRHLNLQTGKGKKISWTLREDAVRRVLDGESQRAVARSLDVTQATVFSYLASRGHRKPIYVRK